MLGAAGAHDRWGSRPQEDGGVEKTILTVGSGWEKPERGDNVNGEGARRDVQIVE